MTSIDQRIVELKFDASKFRSGIQAAIASLDNLKKKLNLDKAAHEFDKVEKASKNVTFSELYSSVDSIANRFSSFGIIGMSVLNNLANTAVNTGKRILSALTEPLIGGGKRRALNIEQAKFQIEGLGYAWADVEEDINYGVKDTAYGLDAAAKAASQLLASQVKVGDEMKSSLRGISGVAAMTSSEYEDIANVFTTVAGNGRLMGDQLMQLSSRGLNAAATLGQYLGKTEAEIRTMTSKGQIDFATFAAAMDSAFGEHAKKANETFSGSLSNMKAALSRIGANFATPAYQNLRDIFNALTPSIDGVKDALDPLVKSAEEAMKVVSKFIISLMPAREEMKNQLAPVMKSLNRLMRAVGTTLTNLFKIVRSIVSPIVSAFKEIFGTSLIDILAGAVEIIAKFTEQLIFTERMSNNLKKTFKGIFTIISVVINILSSVVSVVSGVLFDAFGKVFGFVADILLTITGYIGNLIVMIKKFVDSLLALDSVQQLFSTIAAIFAKIGELVNTVYSFIRKFVTIILDSTFDSALWIFDALASALLVIAKVIDRVIQKVLELIDAFSKLPAVQNFVNNLSNILHELRTNATGVASVLKGKLVNAFNAAKRVITPFVKKIKELAEEYIKFPTFQEMVTNVQTFINDVFEKSAEIFGNVKEFLSDIFERAREVGSVSFNNIIENLGKLRDRIVEVVDVGGKLTFLKDVFTNISGGASEAATTTIGVLSVIKDKVGEFVSAITERFNQLTIGDIMAAGIGGTFIVFLYQLTQFIKTADKLTTTLDKVVGWVSKLQKSVSGVIDNFAALEKAKATSMKMDAISGIIKSVAMLAAAVALLATMDQEKVRSSAVTIGILAGVLVALAGAMTYLLQKVDLVDLGKSISSMIVVAGSILVLAIALKMISDVPTEGIAERLIALGVLMAELVGAMIVLSKFAKDVPEATISILALSLSLNLLARALRNIGEIGVENIISSMAVLAVLLSCVALIVKVAGKATLTWESALGILSIAIAIRVLIGALNKVANMDTATIAKAITRLIAIMGAMALLLISTKLAGEHAMQAGASLILMGVALNIMVMAIQQLANISKSQLKQASESIIGILAIFALITAMTQFAGANAGKAGAAILLMSMSMVAISGAMILLGKLKDEEIARATKAVTSVMAMFALIVASTSLMKKADKTLTVIAITIGVLAASLAVLSLIEPKNLMAASTALSMILGAFAIVVASTGEIKKAKVTLALLGGLVLVLAAVLKMLSDQPWENMLAAGASLSAMILSFSAAALMLSKIGPMASASAAGAAEFLAIVVAFGAILGVLGGLIALIPGAKEFLRNGLPIIQTIGEAIGSFIGGILGGIAAGATATLPLVAASLSRFMKTLQPFLDMVQDVDDAALNGARNVVEMILLFAVADFINGLNLLGGSGSAIGNISQDLPKLGDAMRAFSDSLSGVNLRRLQVGSECAKSIAEIANITREGGLASGIFGSGSEGMKALTDNLPAFGEALKAYGDSLDGLKSDQINASIEPAKGVIEIANSINGEGGLLQELGGSSAEGFKKLGENLPEFARAMVSYGRVVSRADFDAINKSREPVKALVDIANSVKAEGGALQALAGSTALGNKLFAENLKRLGKALVSYSKSISSGIDTDGIMATVDPLKALIEIAKEIDAEGGFLQAIVGSQALGDKLFAENLARLGVALKVFSDNVRDINGDGVDIALHIAESVANILNTLQPTGGLFEDIFGSQESSFSKFNSNLVGLGLGLKLFCDQVADIDGSGVSTALKAGKGIAMLITYLPADDGLFQKLMGGKIEAMSSFAENLGNLASGIKEYCEKVSGIDTSGVEPSVKALKQLILLSTMIEDAGGVAGFWFGDQQQALQALAENIKRLGDALDYISQFGTGENSSAISTMMTALVMVVNTSRSWGELGDIRVKGDDIVYFGNRYKVFGEDVAGIDFGAVESGIYWLKELFKVMETFPQIDSASANFSTFIVTVRNVGVNTVDAFVAALQDGGLRAGQAAYEMVGAAIDQAIFRSEQSYTLFQAVGKNFVISLSNGMRSGKTSVDVAAIYVINDAASTIRGYYGEMVSAGEYLCSGVAQGINNGRSGVIANVVSMAQDMVTQTRTRLDINSPSKEGIKIGQFWDQGIALGVVRYTKDVLSAIDDSSDQMLDRFNDGRFISDLDLQPIITPELDTSLIDKGLNAIDSRFSSMNGIPVDLQGARLASAFSNIKNAELAAAELQNGIPTQVVNNYDMTQNNYSPKALSQFDIYRQTKNQFSRLKGVVNV